ncbi:MAG: glycosyltransferase [Lachnospiraceae bacterium]|nr:glycosyltransferase [Lachnospiraceae bacterium]
MKIAIITNVPSPYRVDFFYYLQTHVKEHEFHVIYSSATQKSRSWHADEERIVNATMLKSWNIRMKRRYDTRDIFIPHGVEKALKEIGPDVVVAMEYNPTVLLACHYCRKHHIPYISWSDGTTYSERNCSKVQKFARRYIIPRACAFIGSSTRARENQIALGADPGKCFQSNLTVDIEKYQRKPATSTKKRLISVGGLILRKGNDLLLEALAKTSSDMELLLVGEGIEKERLEEQVTRLGLTDRVRFAGFLEGDALYRAYAESGAFVLATREDCYGLVILEAMCAHLPVIVSKYADGAVDLVEDGVTGRIVDPEDADGFARALEDVFANESQRATMGEKAYEKSFEFTFEKVSQGYLEAIAYAGTLRRVEK